MTFLRNRLDETIIASALNLTQYYSIVATLLLLNWLSVGYQVIMSY